MKTWLAAPRRVFCGGPCAGEIDTGEPMLVLILPFGGQRVRCAQCAGIPVDYAQIQRANAPGPMEQPGTSFEPLRRIAVPILGRDVKAAAAGEKD